MKKPSNLNDFNLAKKKPELLKEGNYERNGVLTPYKVTVGSSKKVWWICGEGHEWEASIKTRVNGSKCPFCSGRNAIKGVNDLGTINPALAREWHPTKNGKLKPQDFLPNSGKKVWWKCEKGHEWEAVIYSRNNGSRCPICSNKKVLRGFNDLLSLNPELSKEWNYERNHELKPEDVTINSNKKVWWKCEKGHEWESTIANRSNGNGCPICAKKRRVKIQITEKIKHGGSLQDCNPKLSLEWDYEKNNPLKPSDVTQYSNKKVWWKCFDCHNEWQASPGTRKNRGCPVCGREKRIKAQIKTIIKLKGSLLDNNPELSKEWNYEKNGALKPSDVTVSSGQKVWWKCPNCGNQWESTIANRSNHKKNRGCPTCASEAKTSFPEQALLYYFGTEVDVENRKKVYGKEVDIYIPSLKIGIEYDGMQFHTNDKVRSRELEKNQILKNSGIRLYRIKESIDRYEYDITNKTLYYIASKRGILFDEVINTILYLVLGKSLDVNIDRDSNLIMEQYVSSIKKNSIATVSPETLEDWDYEKNGALKPDRIAANSNKKVHWKCHVCGNEWRATPNGRMRGRGCPVCNELKRRDSNIRNQIKIKGSLADNAPELVREWHPTKNGALKPSDILSNSNQDIWWKCSRCGHEWCAKPNTRRQVNYQSGCPICAKAERPKTLVRNQVKAKGSLQDHNPKLALEWNYEKNGDLKPTDVTEYSNKRVWWKCPMCGNEWITSINNRSNGKGCSKCHHRLAKSLL